jgi:hypothetical protein
MSTAKALAIVLALQFLPTVTAAGQDRQEAGDTTRTEQDSVALGVPDWLGRLQVLGTLEGEFRRQAHGDPSSLGGPSTSDLFLRRLEIAVDGKLSDLAEAIFVVNTENLGDPAQGGDGSIVLDEGHIDVAGGDTAPFYLTLGLQTQPFGLFESHSVTDPMTQDAYEIKKVGAVLGITGPSEMNFSVTSYKGEELMSHLMESGLLDADPLGWTPTTVRNVDSFILSGKVTPFDDYLDLFGSLASEPGRNRRNLTIDIGLTLHAPPSQHVLLDAEYAKALRRESYPLAPAQEFKEGVFSSSLSYQFVVRERESRGTNLKGRRSRIRSHPAEVTARIEHFDDDGMSRALQLWSTRNRISVGGRYTIEDVGGGSLYFLAEYRYSSLRRPSDLLDGPANDSNGEIYLRTGIIF